MGGRHRVLKPGQWYCDRCRDVHSGSCPCCGAPEESEPAWLRAIWTAYDKLQTKLLGS